MRIFHQLTRNIRTETGLRQFFKPHSLKQRVMIAAENSTAFEQCVDSITTLSTFLNQMSTDGCARPPARRSFFGMPALEACTNLFSHKHADMEYEEIELPAYMDPRGRLMEDVRRRSFCHTSDNSVHYSEMATIRGPRSVRNYLWNSNLTLTSHTNQQRYHDGGDMLLAIQCFQARSTREHVNNNAIRQEVSGFSFSEL